MPHFTDQIESYLAGGLSPDERSALEAHVAGCPQCALALQNALAVDANMNELFADVRPSADFEDRMIQALVLPNPWLSRPIVHPLVRRAAVGIAASLMLGGIGFLVNRGMDQGNLPGLAFLEDARHARASSNLKNIAAAMITYPSDRGNRLASSNRDHVVHASASRELLTMNGRHVDGPTVRAWLGTPPTDQTTAADVAKGAASYLDRSGSASSHVVAELKKDAISLTKQAKYGDALGVANEILQINPKDDFALGVRPILEDRRAFQTQSNIVELRSNDSHMIPKDDTLRYPTDWSEASPGKPENNGKEVFAWRNPASPGIPTRSDGKGAVSWSDAAALGYKVDLPPTPSLQATDGETKGPKAAPQAGEKPPAAFFATTGKDADFAATNDATNFDQAKGTLDPAMGRRAGGIGGGGAAGGAGGGKPAPGAKDLPNASAQNSSEYSLPWDAALAAAEKDKEAQKELVDNYYFHSTPPVGSGVRITQKVESDLKSGVAKAPAQPETLTLSGVTNAHTPESGTVANTGLSVALGDKGTPQIPAAEGKPDLTVTNGAATVDAPREALEDRIKKTGEQWGRIQKREIADANKAGELTSDSTSAQTGKDQPSHGERNADKPALKQDTESGNGQVAEERKSAALERHHTIADLQHTADQLTKEGKSKEAAEVVAQIQQLEPPNPDETKPNPADPTSPAAPNAPAVQPAPVAPPRVVAPAAIKPKIIRTGEMEFDVDSFESAVTTITKVVEEEGGYVSTTNSDKLPNGKVRGSVVLRVTPDRLDTLVLKLRGIGDLKTQNIRAQDITKQYTDLESRLRAAQIMCDQILDIIKSGKAQVKDLLEAEKQLGVYRQQVEQLQGEINYYANQISLSTLTLTLSERDIRTPALASETETVTMVLITEKVDDAAAKVKDAVAQAKGRIVGSKQEQHEDGRSEASITVQVPPDAAEQVIGRIRQLEGQLDHFDRQRSQTTSNGNSPVDARAAVDPVKVKREDVTINLTIYNLAKLTPRRHTDLSLAAVDVDEAKRGLEDQVKSAGGRIIDSRTEYPVPDQKRATITFDAPAEKADALITALKALGETLQISTIENPGGQGVTESKRGFSAVINDMAGVKPRRQTSLQLIVANIDQAQGTLAEQVRTAGGRVVVRKIEHPAPDQTTGMFAFELPADKADAFLVAMKPAGEMLQVTTTDNNATENVTDSKRGFQISLYDLANVTPRQVTSLTLAAANVDATQSALAEQVRKAGGRVINQQIERPAADQSIGHLNFELPPEKADAFLLSLKQSGETLQSSTADNSGVALITDAKRGFQMLIRDMAGVLPRRVTSLTLVPANVDQAEAALAEQVRTAGGRVIVHKIEHPAPDQSVGTLTFEVPSDKGEALLLSLNQMGETLQTATADNSGGQAVTDSKRGFVISLRSLTTFQSREKQQVTLASSTVRDTFNDLRALIHSQAGRVLTEHLGEEDDGNSLGQLEFEVSRPAALAIDQQMNKDGQVVMRVADRASDTENTIDSKVKVQLLIKSAETLSPRQTSDMTLEVTDVQKSTDDLRAAALSAGGGQIDNPAVTQGDNGQITSTVRLNVPLEQVQALLDKADAMGIRKNRQTSIDTHAPEGKLARAELKVTFVTPPTLASADDGIFAGIRRGLGTSLKVLSTSMMLIVIGLCVVLPFGLVLWGAWRMMKWSRKPSAITPV